MLRQVLWDWNGTLLDDLWYAIGVRDRTFPRFGLPKVESLASYHAEFTFPVRLYYERAGVTDEQFDAVAHAWMDEYLRGESTIPLHADALSVLERFHQAGMRQVILTASKLEVLTQQLSHYPLDGYFERLLGLRHIYATSKEDIGKAYLAECGISPAETVMIGDTLHDAEVARAMGTRCVLVARGHQSKQTLESAGVPVCDTLTEAADRLLLE